MVAATAALQADGYRFVHRPSVSPSYFNWVPARSLTDGDVDCTDMTDEQFAHYVASTEEVTA